MAVTTFAVETFGCLGEPAETLLGELAWAAQRRNIGKGHPPGKPLRRWRATLSAILAKSVARALRAAQPQRLLHT
eukprot:1504520-Karenia_brevis.AAC.1